ncbi:metal ABC transporter permease [Candidatus Agathobaculum pullicola]|uniref:metal ABC transporter permease n=1 Tax=Candidatus Agathobaculum pullicola TaxID=2838426 RepID=UPI003F923CA1
MELFDKLALYWTYPFVRYALIVGVLVALCASLLGVTLVLRRFSFIGDGLSHVAFGAMSIATVFNLTNDMPLVMGITIVCAILLLCAGRNVRIKGDAAMAMLSVGAMAVGYLVVNIFSVSSNLAGDVCTTLFGSTSILTLTPEDVVMCAILSVAVVLLYVFFYHKIFAVTFDENFAAATGIQTRMYNLLLAVVTAVVIVMSMQLVGSLLISALVIFPCMSAMRIFHSFRAVTVCAAILSVCCAAAGIVVSILAGTPVGSTIVLAEIIAFCACSAFGLVRKG